MDADAQLAAIGRLNAMFDRGRIDYWLFGGWAVDFHAGGLTRDHADIDIAIWQTDSAAAHALLAAGGWRHTPAPEQDGFTTYVRGRLHLDLAFLASDERDTVYTPLKSGRAEWPPDSFGAHVCELGGVRAHVVSAASLIVDKSESREDPATATKDAADIAVLRSRTTRP